MLGHSLQRSKWQIAWHDFSFLHEDDNPSVPNVGSCGDIAGKKMDVKTVQGAVMNVITKIGAMIANSNVETADVEACNGAVHLWTR